MLKKSVPPFVAQMREMAELFTAEQPELDRLEGILSELLAQFYIKTATYSLDMWEEEFGLSHDPTLTLQQRRARVLAKLNTRTPATVKMLENLVRQTMGEDIVWIEEHPEDYMFIVYVQEEKLSGLLGIAKDAVHAARPAHLNYRFIERLIRTAVLEAYAGVIGNYILQTGGTVNTDKLALCGYAGVIGNYAVQTGSVVDTGRLASCWQAGVIGHYIIVREGSVQQ